MAPHSGNLYANPATVASSQFDFFGDAPRPRYPDGFRYQPALISASEEVALVDEIRELPFREFEFHGYTGKRRVVYFGWRYDFSTEQLNKADDMPDFLRAIRVPAARFAGLAPGQLQHVLVTEYSAGAGIGWHRVSFVYVGKQARDGSV